MSAHDYELPAFPCEWDYIDSNRSSANGMTMRDYFAAKAMQGILAGDHPITHDPDPLPTVAQAAYKLADAMLKARQA